MHATVFFCGLNILIDPFLSFLVASGVVGLRERQQVKLPPGAIPKTRPSKPPQSVDGEKIWVEETLNIDPVSDLEQNVNGQKQGTQVVTGKSPFCRGLQQHHCKPSHNTQQKLLKQGGDPQPTKSRETSAPKGMCGSNNSVHNIIKRAKLWKIDGFSLA